MVSASTGRHCTPMTTQLPKAWESTFARYSPSGGPSPSHSTPTDSTFAKSWRACPFQGESSEVILEVGPDGVHDAVTAVVDLRFVEFDARDFHVSSFRDRSCSSILLSMTLINLSANRTGCFAINAAAIARTSTSVPFQCLPPGVFALGGYTPKWPLLVETQVQSRLRCTGSFFARSFISGLLEKCTLMSDSNVCWLRVSSFSPFMIQVPASAVRACQLSSVST